MNFLNRKMFAVGGLADTNETIIYSDNSSESVSLLDFQNKIDSLPDNELFALKKSADGGQLVFSPGLKMILDNATSRKSQPVFTAGNLGSPTSIKQGKDYFKVAKGLYGPAISSLTRGLLSQDQIENNPLDPYLKKLPGSPSIKSITEYDSPFFGEGQGGFRRAMDRGGRTTEELESIIRNPGDFSKEIAALENPQIEEVAPIDAVESIDPIKQIEDIEPIPDPTFTPKTESDTLGQGYQPGSVGYEELEGRRLAYEESLIGVDQFGDPIERPEDIDDEIASLIRETLPAEQTVDIDRSEADSLMDVENKFSGLSADELQIELEKSNIPAFEMPEPELVKVDTTTVSEEATGNKDDSIERKLQEPGFFGSDRFLDFIRNVGGELVRTGQFGEGLASGAAKAAEERAARELMAEQENRKFQDAIKLEMAKNALEGKVGMKPTDAAKIAEYEQLLATDIASFDKNKNSLSNLNTVISILDEGGATGIKGFFGEATDMIQAAIKSDTGKSFEELNPRTRANALLKVLRQANVREILGESGKTISNLDRSIVEDVFGDIKLGTPLAVSLEKLKDSRQNMVNGLIQKQNQIISYSSFFNNVGYSSAVLSINQPLIDLIRSFNFENAESYIAGKNSPGYTEADL